jgi:two-component system, OmpR family, alkaline phosphatase synthesis response regulator PhoP
VRNKTALVWQGHGRILVQHAPIVLVVANDIATRHMITSHLRLDGYVLLSTPDTGTAKDAVKDNNVALVIVDLTHPWPEGIGLCRELRTRGDTSDIPQLVLADANVLTYLDDVHLDADERLIMPFTWDSMRSRVRILLRHALYTRRPRHFVAIDHHTADPVISAGDIHIDIARREVTCRGTPVTLTVRLFDLLVYLASHAGAVLTSEQILTNVWGYVPKGATKTLHVHIRWLREKLERDPANPEVIVTVSRLGYRFVVNTLVAVEATQKNA